MIGSVLPAQFLLYAAGAAIHRDHFCNIPKIQLPGAGKFGQQIYYFMHWYFYRFKFSRAGLYLDL